MDDSRSWKAVRPTVQKPAKDVTLDEGLFQRAFDADVRYLSDTFTTDDLLLLFRRRAGKPAPGKAPHWDTSFPGTNMARFLIGAGRVLQWQEDATLRRRLDEAIDGIDACKMDNGYLHCCEPQTAPGAEVRP